MQGGRVRGNQPGECHTTWQENLTNKRGGKEWRSRKVVWRNGQQKKLTHHLTMIAIAIQVLNQGRSRGGLQLVKKVEGPSQSEFQGGQMWRKWRSQEQVLVQRRGRRHWIMGVSTSPHKVMIRHQKPQWGSTQSGDCWRRSKRRTRLSGCWS